MIPQEKIEQAAKESNEGVSEVMSQFVNAAFEDGVRFAEAEMKQDAQEFAEWCDNLRYRQIDNGIWIRKCDETRCTTSHLYTKFDEERGLG